MFDLNLWEWPACLAAFALGIAAAPLGWLDAVSDRLWRRCRAVTLAGVVGAARPLLLPAEIKALVVAAGAMVGSFALAWVLVKRVPGVGRVL